MKKVLLISAILIALVFSTSCGQESVNTNNSIVPDINTSDAPTTPNTSDIPNDPQTSPELNPDVNTNLPENAEPPDIPTQPTEPTEPAEPTEPTNPPTPVGNMNPLTGLYDGITDNALNTRPVAIMIGNTSDSLPQWGVTQADIIYEMIAEARSTRLMAIFQDHSKIEKIASIRSARPYFIDIAQSYGAVFIHFGGSEPAYEQISIRKDLIHIDGIKYPWEGTVFFRDEWRRKELGREHSVYTTGAYLTLGLAKLKKDLTQTEHPSAFMFGTETSAEGGTPMSKVQIRFKDKHQPYFVYNPETNSYLRFQYKAPHIDGVNDNQISVKNLLILRMDTTDIKESNLGIIDVKTTGVGDGYYFCNGKYIEIVWEKDSYNSPIKYYTKSGEELICSPGQSFVSVVTKGTQITIE